MFSASGEETKLHRTYAEPLNVGWAVPTLLPGVVFKPAICVSSVTPRLNDLVTFLYINRVKILTTTDWWATQQKQNNKKIEFCDKTRWKRRKKRDNNNRPPRSRVRHGLIMKGQEKRESLLYTHLALRSLVLWTSTASYRLCLCGCDWKVSERTLASVDDWKFQATLGLVCRCHPSGSVGY